ncbi:DUF1993 domain-containing protein [Sphingomonas sp. LT1P40]|uniref:DUF1993 domain-containing protein n=1 Tax=Alteristakelama amylovorans TaxID=3096166 RepID=UPI002FCC05FF
MPSLYDVAVPPLIRSLTAMSKFLEKGRVWAEEQGLDEAALTEARLYPDMGPLTAQIQRATDSAKFVAVRVGEAENVPFPDEEVTIAELQARIEKTIAFLKAVPPGNFENREDAAVVLKLPNRELNFTGASYVSAFALPNFYFHVTTAYALLRMKGVPAGKMDYMGAA